jgi:cytochrome oxidase assembly protein ShyY1
MKVPLLPTAFVTAAVAVMIGLGVWQLQRASWKKDLLVRYAQARNLPEIAWPKVPAAPEAYYFRRAGGFCLQAASWRAIAGRNLRDETGWSHIAACRTGAEGPGMQVDAGWSKTSDAPTWSGGTVRGIIAPDHKFGMRLVAAQSPAGLEPSAPPSLDSIPNNHMAYAIQWFLFAAIAAIIYILALRKRQKDAAERQPPGPPTA